MKKDLKVKDLMAEVEHLSEAYKNGWNEIYLKQSFKKRSRDW